MHSIIISTCDYLKLEENVCIICQRELCTAVLSSTRNISFPCIYFYKTCKSDIVSTGSSLFTYILTECGRWRGEISGFMVIKIINNATLEPFAVQQIYLGYFLVILGHFWVFFHYGVFIYSSSKEIWRYIALLMIE